MANFQEAIFTFKDGKGTPLGELKLRASYSGPQQENVRNDYVKCINVPQLSSPTDKFPIEYCTLNPLRGLSKIMLLEETSYDVIFKSFQKKIVTDFLPELSKDVFTRNLFNQKQHLRVGNLNFGSYVGRTYLSVGVEELMSLPIDIEVRSKKIGYAYEYAEMLADLSQDCSALIYDIASPVHQTFKISDIDRKTFYEDFLFLEYLFKEGNLPTAYHRIKESPKTQLINQRELVPLGQAQSMEIEDLMDIVCMPQYLARVENPPPKWPRAINDFVPMEVWETRFSETLDIPENRFVKFLLEQVYDLILKLQDTYDYEGYIKDRLQYFHEEISDYLSDEWLKDVGSLSSIPLNSQILQKMEGYRDVYYFYLNFEFAFQFMWEEFEDCLKASEKRMSQLYEYWCFFRLIDALKNMAKIKTNKNDLVELSQHGWEIRLKRGKKSKIRFAVLDNNGNKYFFEFFYNRGFSRKGKPGSRSYSLPFRPDYTLRYKTPNDGLLNYIHFDAKYRSEKELEDFTFDMKADVSSADQEDLTDEEQKQVENIKDQETSRKYKNADIYKMHTYKDAILNSLGAYVFYPGEREGIFKVDDDYEVPSIGAIPLKPGGDDKKFYSKVDKIIKGLIGNSYRQ